MRACGMDFENDRRRWQAKKFPIFLKNAINISAARNAFMCDGRVARGWRCVDWVQYAVAFSGSWVRKPGADSPDIM